MENVITQHITKTPGTCGGRACIAGHRIRVMDIVVLHEKRGLSAPAIVAEFPGITLADVHAALAYYHDNVDEIENEFRKDEELVQLLELLHGVADRDGMRNRVKFMTAFKLLPASFLCSLLALAGCSGRSASPANPDKPLPVTTVKAVKRTLQQVVEQPARVEAFELTPLYARISGYVVKVNCDIQDKVKGPRWVRWPFTWQRGTVLAELSVPEMDKELEQKRALGSQAKAALEAADANVATSLALVQEAKAARKRAHAYYERWQSEYLRAEDLFKRKVIDEQQRDEARHQVQAADAHRDEVEAKVRSTQAMAKESEARRTKAKADLEVAGAEADRVDAMVQYSRIRAPFDGAVVRRHVNTGDFAHPGGGSKGEPLFVVARADVVRIVADLPEADAVLIGENTPARIRLPALDHGLEGKVTRTAGALEERTRTLRTEVHLPNADGKLKPGNYATVGFVVEFPNRMTLPVSAVAVHGDQALCYRVSADSKAVRTPVQVGRRTSEWVEVLKKQVGDSTGKAKWEDFTLEDRVIRGNLSELADGKPVQVTAAE